MMLDEIKGKLNEYQTDHLFLLIGSNPLPNYVAAHLLLRPKGTIYLVHSGNKENGGTVGTYQIAKRLHDLLLTKRSSDEMDLKSVELIPVDEADGHKIGKEIEKIVKTIPGQLTIGLHYTGGTKTMAVHAYRTIEANWNKRTPPPIFSYLDSRKLQMRFEKVNEPTPILPIPVQLAVHPGISDLVNLHGERLKQEPPAETSYLDEMSAFLWTLYLDWNKRESWRTWIKDHVEPLKLNKPYKDETRKKWVNWKPEAQLRRTPLPWPPGEIGRRLAQALAISSSAGFTLGAAQDKLAMAECSELCDWFNGRWLEDHVLRCLKNLRDVEKLPISQVGKSLDTDESFVTSGSDAHDFEVDVVALSGYQLFAFSCTTGWGKATLKQKLFEALIRGRQLGGDEARIALVTTAKERDYNIAQALEQELQSSWRPANTIKVFTPENNPKLQEALKSWIKRGV